MARKALAKARVGDEVPLVLFQQYAIARMLREMIDQRPGDFEGAAALKAALPIVSALFDFGRWSLDGEASAMRIQATGFAHVPSSLRDWLGGVLEHAARSTGHPYQVNVVRLARDAEDAPVEFTVSLAAG